MSEGGKQAIKADDEVVAAAEVRERPHQSLGNRTPDAVYASGQGGGAKIVEKFGGAREWVFR